MSSGNDNGSLGQLGARGIAAFDDFFWQNFKFSTDEPSQASHPLPGEQAPSRPEVRLPTYVENWLDAWATPPPRLPIVVDGPLAESSRDVLHGPQDAEDDVANLWPAGYSMMADANNYGLNTNFHPNAGTQWEGGMQYNSQSTITTDDLLTGMSASTSSAFYSFPFDKEGVQGGSDITGPGLHADTMTSTLNSFHEFAPKKVVQVAQESAQPCSEHRSKKRKVGQSGQEEPTGKDAGGLIDSEESNAVMQSGGKGKGTDPRSIVDQIDIYDKEIGDTYDYYDDATSFNFGADTTLKEQFLALRKGDHVMGIAIERNKKQRIPLQPAGHSLEILYRGLYPIPQNTKKPLKAPGATKMMYSDWIFLLQELTWRLGLKLGIVDRLPGHLLFFPWYLSKRLKAYFARVHIHFGISSYLSGPSLQPEADGMRQPPSSPSYFKQSPESSKWCEIHPDLLLEFSSKTSSGSAPGAPVIAPAGSTKSRHSCKDIENPPDVAVGERFLAGTKELPAVPIIERVINIENTYRSQIVGITDSLVQEALALGNNVYGTIEQLQEMLGPEGYLQHFDRYRPGTNTAAAKPFSGSFIFQWMVKVALSGKFNIRNNIFGIESLGYSRPKVYARVIPACTWATGMLLLESSALKLLGLNRDLFNSPHGQRRWHYYVEVFAEAVRNDPWDVEQLEKKVLDSAAWA